MTANTAKPFHEAVAEKLIRLLQEGTAPWQKGWEPGEPGALLPMNPMTGKRYQSINAIQLMSQGHADPRWLTYATVLLCFGPARPLLCQVRSLHRRNNGTLPRCLI